MNSRLKKIQILIILIFLSCFINFSCIINDPIPFESHSFSIYKTNNDYFNNVFALVIDDKVSYVPDLYGLVKKDTSVSDTNRIRLTNGYVLDFRASTHEVILSYTFKEYYSLLTSNQKPTINEIGNKIIDNNPFVEFYGFANDPIIYTKNDTAILNDIIRKNELEKYFINVLKL